jgi:hypothetical protein
MRNKKILLLVVLTMIAGFAACCHAGERYGPWRYYAPYYFPPGGCDGHCWSPLDFMPTYESPLPQRPSYDPGGTCRPPGYPAKVRRMARPPHSAVGTGRPMPPPRTYRRSQFETPNRDSAVPRAIAESPDGVVGGRPRPIDHPGPQPRSLNRPAPTSSAY